MRSKTKVMACGLLAGALWTCLDEGTARAQIPPAAERDSGWAAASDATTGIGVGIVSLMPRVYYSSPAATVGWKARWHVSSLAPIMTMTGITLLVDGPIKGAIGSTRPGCTEEQTVADLPGSGCQSYGGPSTHAFASWGATGAGTGIFLVDTIQHSGGRFNIPSFLGNVAAPFALSIVTSVARAQDGSGIAHESGGQVAAGALTGFFTGLLIGGGYALLQEPDCGYANSIVCW